MDIEHVGEGPRCPLCNLEVPLIYLWVPDEFGRRYQEAIGWECPYCGGYWIKGGRNGKGSAGSRDRKDCAL